MVDQNNKLLGQKESIVVVEQLSVEAFRRKVKKHLMSQKQILVIQINTDHFGNIFVFQVLEELIQIIRIADLALNRKFNFGFNNFEFL